MPSSRRALRAIVGKLLQLAAEKGKPVPPGLRDLQVWEQMRLRAEQHKRSHRKDRAASSPVLARPIAELTDDDGVSLGIHRAVRAGGEDAGLPRYLARPHDRLLRTEIERGSRLIVLLGQSSAGKSRACWEAIREALPGWSLWYPVAPSRPGALLAGCPGRWRSEPEPTGSRMFSIRSVA